MIRPSNYWQPLQTEIRQVPWWWWLALAWFTLITLISATYLLALVLGPPPLAPRGQGQESRPQPVAAGSTLRSVSSDAERIAAATVGSRSRVRVPPSARSVPSPTPTPTPEPTSVGKPAGSGVGLPQPWRGLAKCESGGNPQAVNPAGYYGLFQFSLSTWASVGGSGNPVDASVAEQLHRARVLQARSGWGQWPVCGANL